MGNKVEIEDGVRVLGTKHKKKILIPNNNAIPRMAYMKTMLEIKKTKKWITYFAFGKVVKICKHDALDLVYVDFGLGPNKASQVFFYTVHARKQIYTLKVGQYAQFGLIQTYDFAVRRSRIYIALWAMGIYVPKSVDIRNTDISEDEFKEMTEEEYSQGATFLDQFRKND